jgi:hypothetical protein
MSLTITLAGDDPRAEQGRTQLRRLLARYDLRRWQFTDTVRIQTGVIPHSHPVLTLNTRFLKDDERALATYLHEQLHWFVLTRELGLRAALQELHARFPTVPAAADGGARDAFSTYLHLVVCALEYAGLIELIGAGAAHRTVAAADVYTWVYATLLADWPYFRDLLRRHALTLDSEDRPAFTS